MDGISNLFFEQALQELCNYADNKCSDGRLPIAVRFILDDFATNVKINEFPRIVSCIRSRGISAMMMIQSEAQLQAAYGEDGQTIISSADTYLSWEARTFRLDEHRDYFQVKENSKSPMIKHSFFR